MDNTTEATDKIMGPAAIRILGWLGAVLGGAALMYLLNASGDHVVQEQNTRRIASLESDMHELQTTYATNKRVDDLQVEVRANYENLSTKMDNMLKLLLERAAR